MLKLLIIIVVLLLLFKPRLLPRMGARLGAEARKPYRQAKWLWSLFSGTEEEAIRAEEEYGQECARAFSGQFPGPISQTDQELVSAVGSRLADAAKDSNRRFHFTVAASDVANAFALPGGFVFITGSLLDLCERDRNEIAFFLAHEIGHVLRNHARDHMAADAMLNAVSARLPKAGQILRHLASKGYSRMLELEADQEAVRLAAASGFDTHASIGALKRLARVAPGSSGLAEYLSSHPQIPERIRELERSISSTPS